MKTKQPPCPTCKMDDETCLKMGGTKNLCWNREKCSGCKRPLCVKCGECPDHCPCIWN